MTTCPKCTRRWRSSTEQAVCVDLHGACMICTFGTEESRPVTDADRARHRGKIAQITAEARSRQSREYAQR